MDPDLSSGFGANVFSCQFDDASDMCSFEDDTTVGARWDLNEGKTESKNTGTDGDHTTGSGEMIPVN